jgi:hypothetical protein
VLRIALGDCCIHSIHILSTGNWDVSLSKTGDAIVDSDEIVRNTVTSGKCAT